MLHAMKEFGGYNRSRQCISLALWRWTVISVAVPIRICSLYLSVILEGPGTRSSAWLVPLLYSCRGIRLGTTRRRACTEVGPWRLDGVFEQAPRMDAKHFHKCSSYLRVRSWSGKPMHGQYRRLTEQSPVDMEESFGWLKAANLPGASEGLVVAAQDQALRTRYYEHHILHRNVSPTCRVCSAGLETVDHIVAGCSAIAPTDYTDRHNQVASIIHWNNCRQFQVPVESRWYWHQLDRLVETDDMVMMWDTTIPTAGKIKANRPDICLRDKKANTCLVIDISCPAGGNLLKSWQSMATCGWR